MAYLKHRMWQVDGIDADILCTLGEDGRITMRELARRVGLSPPSVTERVRRLEDADVIQGYRARVNPAALGLSLSAYIRIRPMPGQLQRVANLIDELDAVVECHRITGDDCFIAKVHVRSIEELEEIVDEIIPLATTNTSIIQSTLVPSRLPPINVAGS